MSRQRIYDHRIKEMIAEAKDPNLFPDLHIPKSTSNNWIKHGVSAVVTDKFIDWPEYKTVISYQKLKIEYAALKSLFKLLVFALKVFGFKATWHRLPDSESKKMLLSAIEKSKENVSLSKCLEIVGLSSALLHDYDF